MQIWLAGRGNEVAGTGNIWRSPKPLGSVLLPSGANSTGPRWLAIAQSFPHHSLDEQHTSGPWAEFTEPGKMGREGVLSACLLVWKGDSETWSWNHRAPRNSCVSLHWRGLGIGKREALLHLQLLASPGLSGSLSLASSWWGLLCAHQQGEVGEHTGVHAWLYLQCPQDKDQEEGPKFQKKLLDPGIGAHATQDGERSQISFVLLKIYICLFI